MIEDHTPVKQEPHRSNKMR